MRWPLRILWLLVLPAFTPHVGAETEQFPGTNDGWRHFQSPHFDLYSEDRGWDSRGFLHKLELLRASFLDSFQLIERRPLEVTLYYFGSERDFRAYKPEELGFMPGGFYHADSDHAVIVLAPRDDEHGAQRVIFHEYVHHLFWVAEEYPPAWFNEGMAEMFSTIDEESGRLVFGRMIPDRIRLLQQEEMLPLETLFAVDHKSPVFTTGTHGVGVFYAESWALMHYLYLGVSKLPEDRLNLFLKALQSPAAVSDPDSLRKSCRQLLGMDYPELLAQLQRYVQSGIYREGMLPLPKIADGSAYAMRLVPRDEIRERLAELSLRINRAPVARRALVDMLEKNPDDVHLHEVLGMNALRDSDEAVAREHWEKAVTLGSDNPAIYHELAQMESGWFRQFDYYFRLPAERAQWLRRLLRRSIEYAPNQTAAYEMLAWVEATASEISAANVNLVQSHFNTLHDKPRTLLALALIRLHAGDKDLAAALLEQLDRMNPDASIARAAEIVSAKMEGRAVRKLPETLSADKSPLSLPPVPPLRLPPITISGQP
jgi:Tfp pilus assembly protein PilF